MMGYRERWRDRWFTGHIRIGRLVIYGANAMHWALNLRTDRWGFVCFHPPTKTFGGRQPWYFYCSPDGTPTAATFAAGPGLSRGEKICAYWRRLYWGHNYDTGTHDRSFPQAHMPSEVTEQIAREKSA